MQQNGEYVDLRQKALPCPIFTHTGTDMLETAAELFQTNFVCVVNKLLITSAKKQFSTHTHSSAVSFYQMWGHIYTHTQVM